MAAPRYLVEAARRYVREHFPEMEGMRCTGAPAPVPGTYVVTARRQRATSDGRSIERIIRVTIDQHGHVLRTVTSK